MISGLRFFTHNVAPGVLAEFEGRLDSSTPYNVRGTIIDSIRDNRARVMWPTNRERKFFVTPADRDATEQEEKRILAAWRDWKRKEGIA